MNGIKRFLYLEKNGDISHSRFWSNVGYAALTCVFLYAGIHGAAVDPNLLMVFGAVVIGNRTLKVALHRFNLGSTSNKNEE